MTNCSYPFRTRTRMISLYRLQSTCEPHCPFRVRSLRNFMLLVITFGGCVALCASVPLRLSAVWAVFSHSLFSTICCTIPAYNYTFTTTPSFNFLGPPQWCASFAVSQTGLCLGGEMAPVWRRAAAFSAQPFDKQMGWVTWRLCFFCLFFFYSHPKCGRLHFSVLSIMSLIVLAGRNNDGANRRSCKQQTWWSYW